MFAALDVLTGKVSANAFHQRHTNTEFVDFLGQIAAAHPDVSVSPAPTPDAKTVRANTTAPA